MFTYLLSSPPGRNPTMVGALLVLAEHHCRAAGAPGDQQQLGTPMGYWWGANGAVARTAMNLCGGERAHARRALHERDRQRLDHLLGRNTTIARRSRGSATIRRFTRTTGRRRRIACSTPGRAAGRRPGLSVGRVELLDRAESDWQDTRARHDLNEIAVNWNGALVYAAAAMAQLQARSP